MTEDTSPDPHKVVYYLPSTVPYEWPVLFPSFYSEVSPLEQAIAQIKRLRPDMWECLEKGYSCGFVDAVRARDYFTLLRIADQRNQYLLPCWMVVMASSLFPRKRTRKGRR